FTMGVGLWNASAGKYLLPQASASATAPGGAGALTHPAAFFNVAFRTHEPFPTVNASPTNITDAAWWRDRSQGTALAAGNISSLFVNVSFAKLAHRATDNSRVPRTGPM